MNTNMMELNMNEMAAISAGEMTREERQEALAAKDGDNIVTRLLKMGMRKNVNGIDAVADLAEPLTRKLENFTGENARTAAKNIFKGLWNTVKGWF